MNSMNERSERIEASTPVLVVRDLVVRFKRRTVLDGASLELFRGETVFLLGANGAGKTTLLRALIGTAPVGRGTVRIGDLDARGRTSAVRRLVGFVPDATDLPEWMTPREALRFVGCHYPNWSAARALELLGRFGVDEDAYLGELSRGQGLLVALAAALGHAPRVLLLDEPFANLDPGARVRVQRCLLEHVDTEATACLVSTHDLDVAARLADRVLLLEGGRVRELGRGLDTSLSLAQRRESFHEQAFAAGA